jgi:RNA polymerase sigma factor (sigma-70 family)
LSTGLLHIDKIIDGCKGGDRRAQEQLYRNFYQSMMNLCMRYTKDEVEARSLLNTGFLKVFKNIEKFNSERASLYTWIRAIVVNCCIDHIKSKEALVVTDELTEASDMQSISEIDTKMNTAEILKLIRLLPPATQAVFNLYIMEGYGHKEIGLLLQISEGTSKWHLSEARKNLKEQLTRR